MATIVSALEPPLDGAEAAGLSLGDAEDEGEDAGLALGDGDGLGGGEGLTEGDGDGDGVGDGRIVRITTDGDTDGVGDGPAEAPGVGVWPAASTLTLPLMSGWIVQW